MLLRAAHIISYVKFTDGVQNKYPIWENIVLICADTEEAAYEEAEQLGKMDYDGGELSWEGRPAIWTFAGIRKVIKCQYVASRMKPLNPTSLATGLEISYLQLEIASETDFMNYVRGESVHLCYDELGYYIISMICPTPTHTAPS